MQELIDQVVDYLKGIWLKRRYIIVMSWLICPIGWYSVTQLDDVYQSNARVFADTQSILGPLLEGLTVETDPEMQIQLMIKTLLSRPNLERISRMTDLDVQATTPKQYEQLIERLRKEINIRKTGGRNENIFSITFEDKNPEIARGVVQSALTVFIENTLGDNRTDSDSAQKFLDTQIKEYENRLLAAEARLTDFKQKYRDVLPSEAGGYYTQLRLEKERLAEAQLALQEVENSIKSANAQLQSSSTSAQQSSDKINDATSVSTSYDERIKQIESSLDGLLLRYTDKHPDVAETKRLLDNLNKARKEELENYYATLKENDGASSSNLNALNINPVYQEIRIKLNELNNEAASLKVRVANYKTKTSDLENKIHIIPEIEAELIALDRGYNITKSNYEELLSRKETAQLAQQAEQTTSKINFRIIDPPRAPTEPTGPKRILLLIAVTFVGLGSGIGLSFLFSQINPVVTSVNQIHSTIGIPVFGIVSATDNLGLKQWHKRKALIFIASNVFLLLIFVVFLLSVLFPEVIQAPLRRIF
jgi:polysaccharide chain length determinant protein (PEP-CTERM system associated)